MIPEGLREPLPEFARVAREVAPDLCARGEGMFGNCSWYHPLHPVLRQLELAATPEREAEFYRGALQPLARSGDFGRVAITGTADACMLAHLLWPYRHEGADPRVTVVERCATPLRICELYAERVAADVRIDNVDVLRWEPEERFDVVTTHGFIGMFLHAEQDALVAKWRQALRAGGKLVTVARIDTDWTLDRAGFSESQAAGFVGLVESRARESGAGLGVDPAVLAEEARVYAARMRSHPFATRDDLVDLLERGGFEVERLDVVELPGNAGAGQSGPGAHRPGTFAHFVATAAG